MREGWEYKKLGELCTSISDGSHNPPKGIDHSLYRMISSQNVFDDNLQITEDNVRYITESDHLCENKRTKLQKDVVLLTIVGTIGRSCVLKGNEGCLTLQRSVAALHPSDQIMPRYLMHCLIGNRHTLNQEAHGIAQKGIYLKQLSSLSIPLPPKSTQLAIVSELDKINELIRLKKEQLKDFDNLAQSIFYEMFGDPVENEMGWEVKKLGDSIKVIGGYAFCSKNFLKSGIPVLRIGNINTGKFTPTNMVYWQKDEELSRYRILPGDLVISLTGTVGKSDYGNVCILGNDYEEYYLNQRNAKLEVGSNLNKYFLTYLLKQDMIRKKLTGINRGVRQANIANRDIENLNIPLPPLPLQHLFAHRIEQIEHQKVEVQKTIADLETLLASRMQYWFE